MKKLLIAWLIGLTVVSAAADTKDIPYYEADAQKTGDAAYLAERCKLDLYLPAGEKDFPTLVWFHGGGLAGGSKQRCPSGLNLSRIALASVNYRLSGKRAQCPDYIYDAAAAVAWVRKHIAEYGGDPAKVYVAGHSAGGYLTAMLALDPKYLETFGCDPHDLAGYLPISGQMTTHYRILAERRAKDPSVPDVVLDGYAPIRLAGENVPPMVLLVGDPEVEWPSRVEENLLLAARLTKVYRNADVKCYSFPTFDHGGVVFPAIAYINRLLAPPVKK